MWYFRWGREGKGGTGGGRQGRKMRAGEGEARKGGEREGDIDWMVEAVFPVLFCFSFFFYFLFLHVGYTGMLKLLIMSMVVQVEKVTVILIKGP